MLIVVTGDIKQALEAAGVNVPVAVDEEHPASFNLDEGFINRLEYDLRDSDPAGDKELHRQQAIVKAAAEVLGVKSAEQPLPSAADLDAVAYEQAAKEANEGTNGGGEQVQQPAVEQGQDPA